MTSSLLSKMSCWICLKEILLGCGVSFKVSKMNQTTSTQRRKQILNHLKKQCKIFLLANFQAYIIPSMYKFEFKKINFKNYLEFLGRCICYLEINYIYCQSFSLLTRTNLLYFLKKMI